MDDLRQWTGPKAWSLSLMMLTLAAVALTGAGCGTSRTGSTDSAGDAADDDGAGPGAPAVQSCKPKPAAAMSLLANEVTYAKDLYPIMNTEILPNRNQPTGHCSQCHAGNNDDRPNTTNCLYLKDNIDNVIKRLDNARSALIQETARIAAVVADVTATPQGPLAAGFAGDPLDANAVNAFARTNAEAYITGLFPQQNNPERTMPPYPFNNQRQPITRAEADLFKAFRDSTTKCEEGEPADELADIPVPDAFSDAEAGALPGEGDVAKCEDGPTINTDANWELVADLLKGEEDPKSAFYDYETKDYVSGAVAASFDCTWDAFILSLDGVAGVSETMGAYRDYGWRLLACTVVDGLPRASMATLTKVTGTNGDSSLALNWKAISLDRGDVSAAATDSATATATATGTAAAEGE